MARRQRMRSLCGLRRWRDAAMKESNGGRRREMIIDRPEVSYASFDHGWTCVSKVRLRDGFEIMSRAMFSIDADRDAVANLYRELSRRLRRQGRRDD